MRSIFVGIIALSASMVDVQSAHADKHGDAQALISHRQPLQASRDKPIGVDQVHPDEDALTKRIEQDNMRLDRLIDICPNC
jgi:hypothetical protein